MNKLKLALTAIMISTMLVLGAFPAAAVAAPANGTGFEAAIVALSGQKITGEIDASGFDIGIYVGPGVRNVTITKAHVFGANDEGILVQGASNVVIKDSNVSGNGLNPHIGTLPDGSSGPDLSENKGIVLAGTKNCLVKNNIVENNLADGGISVIDDGPNHPYSPESDVSTAVSSFGNVITDNIVRDNAFGCGIVLAAKNPGGGVFNNIVSKNTVEVTDPLLGGLPRIGGIIVAGGAFGVPENPLQVSKNLIINNEVTGGLIGGISLHVFGPAIISDTKLIGNVMSNNGGALEAFLADNTVGIEIAVPFGVGSITGTQILNNTISNDYYGVWEKSDTGTQIVHLTTNGVSEPVFVSP